MSEWSESDLVYWVNQVLDLSPNCTSLTELSSGAEYTQLLDSIYPGEVGLEDVKFPSGSEDASARRELTANNLAIFRRACQANGFEGISGVDWEAIAESDPDHNITLCDILHRFWETNYRTESYDPVERRKQCASRAAAPAPALPSRSSQTELSEFLDFLEARRDAVAARKRRGTELAVEREQHESRVLQLNVGEMVPEYQQLFSAIDQDGNGYLDIWELSEALDVPFDKCLDLLARGDTNMDTVLDFPEFVELFARHIRDQELMTETEEQLAKEQLVRIQYGPEMAAEYKALLNQIDTNQDGLIDIRELATALNLPLAKCMELIVVADKDGDNHLNLPELAALISDEKGGAFLDALFAEAPIAETPLGNTREEFESAGFPDVAEDKPFTSSALLSDEEADVETQLRGTPLERGKKGSFSASVESLGSVGGGSGEVPAGRQSGSLRRGSDRQTRPAVAHTVSGRGAGRPGVAGGVSSRGRGGSVGVSRTASAGRAPVARGRGGVARGRGGVASVRATPASTPARTTSAASGRAPRSVPGRAPARSATAGPRAVASPSAGVPGRTTSGTAARSGSAGSGGRASGVTRGATRGVSRGRGVGRRV